MRKTSDITDVQIAKMVIDEASFSGLDINKDWAEISELVGYYSNWDEGRLEPILQIVRNELQFGHVQINNLEE